MLALHFAHTTRERESAAAYELLAAAWHAHFSAPMPEILRETGGRPCFRDSPVQFSLSHSGGYVCVALSDQRVGVDLECVRPIRNGLPARVLAPEELRQVAKLSDETAAFFRFWTLKEAYLKYTGTGLRGDLRALRFTLSGANATLCGSDLHFSSMVGGGRVLSLCMAQPETPTLFGQL